MINGWERNYCNVLAGVFSKNCEDVKNAGKDKPTMCPPNKFWTGIKKGGHFGLDDMSSICCEMEYHAPLVYDDTTKDALPEGFKVKEGVYLFQAKQSKKWLNNKY